MMQSNMYELMGMPCREWVEVGGMANWGKSLDSFRDQVQIHEIITKCVCLFLCGVKFKQK
jgi:hypothetical protein